MGSWGDIGQLRGLCGTVARPGVPTVVPLPGEQAEVRRLPGEGAQGEDQPQLPLRRPGQAHPRVQAAAAQLPPRRHPLQPDQEGAQQAVRAPHGGPWLPHGQDDHQAHHVHRGRGEPRPGGGRPPEGPLPGELPRLPGREGDPGGRPLGADLHGGHRGLGHGQHEVHAQRGAHHRHHGRGQRGDGRGGGRGEPLHLRHAGRGRRGARPQGVLRPRLLRAAAGAEAGHRPAQQRLLQPPPARPLPRHRQHAHEPRQVQGVCRLRGLRPVPGESQRPLQGHAGVDQEGDQEHRGVGEVLQRPHHRPVRPGDLGGRAHPPAHPRPRRAPRVGPGRLGPSPCSLPGRLGPPMLPARMPGPSDAPRPDAGAPKCSLPGRRGPPVLPARMPGPPGAPRPDAWALWHSPPGCLGPPTMLPARTPGSPSAPRPDAGAPKCSLPRRLGPPVLPARTPGPPSAPCPDAWVPQCSPPGRRGPQVLPARTPGPPSAPRPDAGAPKCSLPGRLGPPVLPARTPGPPSAPCPDAWVPQCSPPGRWGPQVLPARTPGPLTMLPTRTLGPPSALCPDAWAPQCSPHPDAWVPWFSSPGHLGPPREGSPPPSPLRAFSGSLNPPLRGSPSPPTPGPLLPPATSTAGRLGPSPGRGGGGGRGGCCPRREPRRPGARCLFGAWLRWLISSSLFFFFLSPF
ncbi:glycogen phosphorylase, muscle form isoform X1 [Struthio camelus]|uniref:glycogen phosphorylase, muscle form isoform X1 n=1 Tax=Struthio camelus TaxID=8801 RepID=UPI003603CB8C